MSGEHERRVLTEKLVGDLYQETKFYSIETDMRPELWVYKDGIYENNGECYIKQFCRKELSKAYTTHISSEVIEKIRADNYVNPQYFFNINNVGQIAVLNGILDLNTRQLQDFTKEMVFFNKFNITYDVKKNCPKIIKFVQSIVRKKSEVQVIQELFGDLLWKEYKFEKCFMFIGNGRNGKSKLAELMKLFVGPENTCAVHPSTIEDPKSTTISYFHGKIVNLAMDINDTALRNISVLKSLSGRDQVTAERKFLVPLSFENYALMIFGCNKLPMVYDISDSAIAFWERFILLEFPYTFTDRKIINSCKDASKKKFMKVKNANIIKDILTDSELSGLLNWALDGLDRLNKNGCYSYDLTPSEVAITWIKKSDSFKAFFMDHLEIDYDSKICKKDLRKMYVKYCKGHRLKTLSDIIINKSLSNEGVTAERIRKEGFVDITVWEGVKFKQDLNPYVDEYGICKLKSNDNSESVYSNVDKNGQVKFN